MSEDRWYSNEDHQFVTSLDCESGGPELSELHKSLVFTKCLKGNEILVDIGLAHSKDVRSLQIELLKS